MLLIKLTCIEHIITFTKSLNFTLYLKKAYMFEMQKKTVFIFRRMYNLVSLICQLNMQTVKVNQRQT